jgi:putative acetyltransferase
MLRGLTRGDWLAWLGIPEERIPQALILRGTRNLKANYEKHRLLFDDVLEVGPPNGIFEDVLIGAYRGIDVGYASVYGDAMASEITHVFGVLGTPTVIQTGCCGALSVRIAAGDIVCVATAYCAEGAAQYYTKARAIAASPDLLAAVARSSVEPVTLHTGSVVTTSALLAEGREEIEAWCRDGHIAVDMETATTFAVAEHFGMRRLSMLFAFDDPCAGGHVLLSDEEKPSRREFGEQVMIELALSIAAGAHEITISQFQPEDQCRAKELILAGLAEHLGILDPSMNPDLDDIRSSYAGATFLVAWCGGRIVGTGALVPRGNGTAEIVRMSVAADTRRRGIGSAILQRLCERAKDDGCKHVVLETTETWSEIIEFYKRSGFHVTNCSDGNTHFALDLTRS